MSEFDLANATDLVRWSDRLESRSRFPELIRRLISATASELVRLEFRADEGVQLPGWDGIADAVQEGLYVPRGLSVWELGTNGRVALKANEDFNKRTADPGDLNPVETTFVFVTSRRWTGKTDWAADRKSDSRWKDVRAYDADDLAHWMELARGVHAWFSALIGKDPHSAESLESWWDSWSQATSPPIPSDLLLSGRFAAVEKVRIFLQQIPSSHTLATESQEEGVAFVAATLHQEGGLRSFLARSLIVRTPSAWRRLVVSEQPLVLIPLFQGADVAHAIRMRHHVIIPVGREIGTEAQYELPRLSRNEIEAALKRTGLPDGKAERLATIGRRSLLSMRRTMAPSAGVHTPEWSSPENARGVLPAVLAGRWINGQEADRNILAKLADRPYDDVAATLVRWANTSDPPVRRVGNVWFIAAKQDAWTLMARHLTTDDISRFQRVALEVLGSDDPSLEVSARDRLMAPVLGKTRPYSSHLVEGLADTLAMMGALSDYVHLGEWPSEDIARNVVRSLLADANADPTGQKWSILSTQLPALAEAAPDVFLRAVDAGLSGGTSLSKVFQDHEKTGYHAMSAGSSAHTGLLWALESLAWNPEYITTSTLALARLAVLDPGGRLANRPFNSLCAIHVLWTRGTAATVDERMQALDVIHTHAPVVFWDLLLNLLPSGHGSTSPPHAPAWRDWKPDDIAGIPYSDLFRGVEAVCRRILSEAKGDAWAEVVGRFPDFPPPFKSRILETLKDLDPSKLSENTRQTISDTARELVARHRSYPDAGWSLSSDLLNELEASCEHLIPEDPTYRHRWLFTQTSVRSFGGRGNNGRRNEEIERVRTDAVAEIYENVGVPGVLDWAEQFESELAARWLGQALGGVGLTPEEIEIVWAALVSEKDVWRKVASSYAARRASAAGEKWTEWVQDVLSAHREWSPDHKAHLLASLPETPELWDIVQAEGSDVDKEYWLLANHYGLPAHGDACVRAARKLLEHGRPHTAVDILDLYADEITGEPPDELVADVLEESATTEPLEPIDHMFTYHAGRHLDRLAEHSYDEKRLASLEWMYLRVFRYENRRSPILHSALSKNPEDFVAMISIVYRAEGEEPQDLSESEQAYARTAHDLLESWHDLPGLQKNMTVDRACLFTWVENARTLLSEAGRLRIGDHHIGAVLRYGPPPTQDLWPCEPICELIEAVASDDLEDGLSMEIYNSRGATSRGVTEGGTQERQLAEKYHRYALSAGRSWPRTGALLERVSRTYTEDARRHDVQAELAQDLWR